MITPNRLLLFKRFTIHAAIAFLLTGHLYAQADNATIHVSLKNLKPIATIDERFQSYNIEMVEVVGGRFWIPYDKIDTTKKASLDPKSGINQNLFYAVPPIDLSNQRLRKLAAALGPAYLRVSGTWANTIYFQDNDAPKLKSAPAGFKDVLSRDEWKGVVDFSKAVDASLVTSFAVCDGVRDKDGVWTPEQANALIRYTQSVGGTIAGAEFFNEPNFASYGGAPKGYTAGMLARDMDIFHNAMRKIIPGMKILGPGSVGEGGVFPVATAMSSLATSDLLAATPQPRFDIFSYHFYGAASKRCVPAGPGSASENDALSEAWLSKTEKGLAYYAGLLDQFSPGMPIWLTETADAACGGNPWATSYRDCFRYIEQLGRLAKNGVQVVMHNTLSASEYGLLDQYTHTPRPNYWAAWLWSRFMGTKVFDAGKTPAGVDIFMHNLKHSKKGIAVLAVNTLDRPASLEAPRSGVIYTMTADDLTAKTVRLNGKELVLSANDDLPGLTPMSVKQGVLSLPPHSISFLCFE